LASQRTGNLDQTSDGVASVDHGSNDESGDAVNEADEVEVDKEEEDPLATSDEEDGDGFSDHNGSDSDTEPETQVEKDRKAAYFDSSYSSSDTHSSFLTMNLSRPILKAITALGFSKPTPIQAAAIPVALLGKDVVGGAVTGSGKTAAFIIPMLERLLYRDRGKKAAAIRCLILVPTRELAVQCFEVGSALATHTDIRFCLITGALVSSDG
jgi:ATP-dependent RNA helicase DDX27